MQKFIPADINPEFDCKDCKQNTSIMDEYYMVRDQVWRNEARMRKGMLCIGCLERRIDRKLLSIDFIYAPINFHNFFPQSERLRSRLAP